MQKTVFQKGLCMLVTVALVLSPSVEAFAASNDEILEIIDVKENINVEENTIEETENYVDVNDVEVTDVDVTDVDVVEEFIDDDPSDFSEVYVEEIDSTNDYASDEEQEISFTDNKSEPIPGSEIPVDEPVDIGVDISTECTLLTDVSISKKGKVVTNPISIKSAKIAGLKTTVSYIGKSLTVSDIFNSNDKTCKNAGWNSVTLYVVDRKTKAKIALVEDSDYIVSIDSRSDIGKVKVKFSGINNYTGTITKTVTIKAAKVAKEFDITVDDATFTKGGVKPKVTVSYAGRTLKQGKDYKVTYKNNKKVASSTDGKKAPCVIVQAKGNYAGTSDKITFTINKANVSDLQMQAKDITYKAKGKNDYFLIKPFITDNNKKVSIGKNKDIKATFTYTYAKKTTLKDGTIKAAGDLVDKKDKLSGTTSIKVYASVEAGSTKSSYEGNATLSCTYKVIDKNKPIEDDDDEDDEKPGSNPVTHYDGIKETPWGELNFSVGENKDHFMINDSENTINFTFLSNTTDTNHVKFYISDTKTVIWELSSIESGKTYEFSYNCLAKNYESLSVYAEFKGKTSNTVTISAYEPLTAENAKAAKNAIDTIESIDDSYISNGNVDSINYSSIISAIEKEAEELEQNGVIIEHREYDDHVAIKFANGIKYFYSIPKAGVKGTGKDVSIYTYQPYADDLPTEPMDYSATYIDHSFDNLDFLYNLDNDEVTPNYVFNNISSDQVVIWDGHGGFEEEYGALLITGEQWDGNTSHLPAIGDRWLINDNRLAIDSYYFEQLLDDDTLDNSFIILNACYTAKSAGDISLCETLISKGASAVVGFDNPVNISYANNLIEYMLVKMCDINPYTGMYYTAYEALCEAAWVYGEDDEHGTKPIYFGNTKYRFPDAIEAAGKDDIIPVTDISLNTNELKLTVGEKDQLIATVTPDNATNKNITWISDDDSVVIVDQEGVVKALTTGKTTITAMTEDGHKTAKCEIAVSKPAKIPNGAVIFGSNYYKIFDGSYTWTEAKEKCEELGGHLVTITSAQEQAFIETVNSDRKWIGGYRDDDFNWYWVTGEDWDYTNWADGEPNNSKNVISNENKVAIWPQKWNDLTDSNTREQSGFICEWEGREASRFPNGTVLFGSNYYKVLDGTYTWTEAKEKCEELGGHLVTITSAQEQAFIESINSDCRWIGGYRDDDFNWYWVTGEDWDYTNWADGEPNNSRNVISNENKAAIWPQKWNDLADSNTREQSGFICEWE